MSQDDMTYLLTKHPRGLTKRQLTELSGLAPTTVRDNLRDMRKWETLDMSGDWIPIYTLRVIAE